MVTINFSVFIDKIKSGEKKQTIRLFKKKWKDLYERFIGGKNYLLQLYTGLRTPNAEKIIEDQLLRKLKPIFLDDITEEIAKKDGFNNLKECIEWFYETYPNIYFTTQKLVIIYW